jgi:hypothetical protein
VTTKFKQTLAVVLAGGALAIGVPAALAAGGGDDGASTQPSSPTFIQDEGGRNGQAPNDQNRPDRGDCPERDGGGQDGGGSSESSGGETAL